MSQQVDADVIIIGAGISGLTSAYRILQKDVSLKVIVLEAKERVGGRTLTQEISTPDGKTEFFDLGGQWVSHAQIHIMQLLDELGLETYPQDVSGTKFMQVGDNRIRTYTSDIPSLGSWFGIMELQFFLWKVERLCQQVPIEDPYSSPLADELGSLTVETFMRKNLWTKAARDTITIAIKATFGTDPARMSTLYLLAYGNAAGGIMKLFLAKDGSAQELKVKGGAQQISELLADRVGRERVLLNQPVTQVVHDQDIVFVTIASGMTYKSHHLIISISPNMVLRINFTPPLPVTKRIFLENMPMGHLTKFIVVYEKAYWKEKGYSGEIVSTGGPVVIQGCDSGPISITYDATTHNGTPALVGFISGKTGSHWNERSLEERRAAVLEGLSHFLGDWAKEPLQYLEKVWADEPFTGGCPICFGIPGTMYCFHQLRTCVGRIHWAGTETATEWCGYMNGAVQAGERAAVEVLYELRPQALTVEDLKSTKDRCQERSLKKDTKQTCFGYSKIWLSLCIAATGLAVTLLNMKFLKL